MFFAQKRERNRGQFSFSVHTLHADTLGGFRVGRNENTRSTNCDDLSDANDEAMEDSTANLSLKNYEESARYYEQQARSRANMKKGDWWIAISLYLFLFSLGVALF
jgi:hypothetical protein